MKTFSFEADSIFGLCKLPDQWRFLELFRQYYYQINLKQFDGSPFSYDKSPAYETQKKIIRLFKKNHNKLIEENFEKEYEEIHQFFYNQNSHLKFSIVNNLMDRYLGPLGFKNSGIFYDINDFEEIYIVSNKKAMTDRDCIYGTIKSKVAGWCSWMLINEDNKSTQNSSASKYIHLTSVNHFKMENSLQNLFDKKRKFEESKTGRTLKKLFVSNSFWFHDDLDKFYNSFKSIIIDDYSKNEFSNYFLNDLK
jgi:hypothetical protein